MKFWDKIKQRHRLRRIEGALSVKLTEAQRKTVLCPERPIITGERRSGKTLTACMWVLFHRKEPLIVFNELDAFGGKHRYGALSDYRYRGFPVPDPDLRTMEMAAHCLYQLVDMHTKCRYKKIPVFDLYINNKEYRKAQEGKK